MIDRFQQLLLTDSGTARFILVYVVCLSLLYAASAIHARVFPLHTMRRREPSPSNGSRLQSRAKRFAAGFAHWIASLNITPNQITLIGLVLVVLNCLAFVVHLNTFLFGTGLIAAYLFDTLDGVVARAQGSSTRFGGYLDAVVDRYQEVATYFALGLVTGEWGVVFAVITGSMLISYNKARVAIETRVDNKGWPDLLSKPMRLFILCVALIGDNNLPWLLPFTLWALALMTHFTAVQRVIRAYLLIRSADQLETSRVAA